MTIFDKIDIKQELVQLREKPSKIKNCRKENRPKDMKAPKVDLHELNKPDNTKVIIPQPIGISNEPTPLRKELTDAIRVVDGQQFEFHRAIGVKRKENGEKEYWATNPPTNMSLPSNLANYVIKQINDNKIPMYPEQSLLWISFLMLLFQ